MTTPGQRALDIVEKRLRCAEDPPGSNNGACVREAQRHTWLRVPRPGERGWPWCVAEWQRTMYVLTGEHFPYQTASVAQLADYCVRHGFAIPLGAARIGDAACLGNGRHITIFADILRPNGTFIGLGGNQSDRVKESTYLLSDVSTVISTAKVFASLDPSDPTPKPPPKKRPKWEIVRGEGERSHVVFTGTLDNVIDRLEQLLRKGAQGAGIRKRRP